MTPLAMVLVQLGESYVLAGEIGSARECFTERYEIQSAKEDFCRTGELIVPGLAQARSTPPGSGRGCHRGRDPAAARVEGRSGRSTR